VDEVVQTHLYSV